MHVGMGHMNDDQKNGCGAWPQVQQGQPASAKMAVSTMLAELVAEQQALKEATQICHALTARS